MLGQIHLTHAALAKMRHYTVTASDHVADQIHLGSRRREPRAVLGTERDIAVILFPALGAHLARVHECRT